MFNGLPPDLQQSLCFDNRLPHKLNGNINILNLNSSQFGYTSFEALNREQRYKNSQ